MAFQHQWLDDEQTVIRSVPQGRWTWADYHQMVGEVRDMLQSVSHQVDVILDFSAGLSLPGPHVLRDFRKAYAGRPANHGVTVVVGMSAFVETMLGILMSVMGDNGRFRAAHTLDNALALIETVRAEAQHAGAD